MLKGVIIDILFLQSQKLSRTFVWLKSQKRVFSMELTVVVTATKKRKPLIVFSNTSIVQKPIVNAKHWMN